MFLLTCTMGNLPMRVTAAPPVGVVERSRDDEASNSSSSVSRRPKRETSMRHSVATTRSPPFSLTIRTKTCGGCDL